MFAPVMSFDRLAPHYRWMEAVLAGDRLQRCRLAHIGKLAGCDRVLLAGEGHGRFLAELVRRWPDMSVVHLDASPGMQAVARRRLAAAGAAAGKVEFVTADVRECRLPAGEFAAVVTHFFLDCFGPADLGTVVGRLAESLRPEARWLQADFCVPERGWRRWRARMIVASMYAAFRVLTRLPASRLHAPGTHLNAHGFRLRDRVESEWGLLGAEWWQRPGGVI